MKMFVRPKEVCLELIFISSFSLRSVSVVGISCLSLVS